MGGGEGAGWRERGREDVRTTKHAHIHRHHSKVVSKKDGLSCSNSQKQGGMP